MNGMDFGGVVKSNESKSDVLNMNSSEEVFSIDTSQLMKNVLKKNGLFYAEMLVGNKPIVHTIIYFTLSNQLRLSKPNYSVHLKEDSSGRPLVEISSDVLAKNVFISIPGKTIKFSDNYFDMLPGKKYLIWSPDGGLTNDDVNKMDVKSLIDTYQ